jgi:alkylation response protein AidB-like acyl-CoA dehydrogenase
MPLRRAGTVTDAEFVTVPALRRTAEEALHRVRDTTRMNGMNFDDTPQEAAFRAEAKAWIATNAPKQYEDELRKASLGRVQLKGASILEVAKAWQKKKADAGWACLHWPKEYGGRGATPIERVIWQQEEGAFGKLSGMFIIGHGMCGPTMMAFAGEDQKRQYLPPLASGEKVWCQLFSEPAGGSDVAGLRTRAEKNGGDWIVNGQKIWTSGAHYSDYGILLTRTDPNVAKHKGLTMFFLDMKSPGVEIEPIKQANGQSEFNEVYFTDVKIPDIQRLGEVNDGWNVSLTTLMNERMSIGAGVSTGFPELFEFCGNLMLEDGLAIDDRSVRSKLAHWAVRASGLKYTSFRAISALSKGERPGPENSIGKLVAGSMIQDIAAYALDLQGAAGVLSGPEDAEAAGKFQAMLLRAPGTRVEGGTDEIMRNIIAERVLGLPGDIRVDKDVPFNKIPTKGRG